MNLMFFDSFLQLYSSKTIIAIVAIAFEIFFGQPAIFTKKSLVDETC